MLDSNLTHGTVEQIVEDNLGLVVTIVSRFGVKSANFDDCVCEGNIGLLTGARKVVAGVYDSEKSALSTFLGLLLHCCRSRHCPAGSSAVATARRAASVMQPAACPQTISAA